MIDNNSKMRCEWNEYSGWWTFQIGNWNSISENNNLIIYWNHVAYINENSREREREREWAFWAANYSHLNSAEFYLRVLNSSFWFAEFLSISTYWIRSILMMFIERFFAIEKISNHVCMVLPPLAHLQTSRHSTSRFAGKILNLKENQLNFLVVSVLAPPLLFFWLTAKNFPVSSLVEEFGTSQISIPSESYVIYLSMRRSILLNSKDARAETK